MGEPRKDARASADSENKSANIGQEIDEDFLTAWKPAKVAENNLDFKCDTPPSKKKGFSFGKLDIDFSLDGDFNKIAAFKLDMADLDFSSPPRNVEKPNKRISNKTNLGRQDGKQDLFALDFNFNESDGFDLDMGFSKREIKPSTSDDGDQKNCHIQGCNTKNTTQKNLASKINSANVSVSEMGPELETGTTFTCTVAAETGRNLEEAKGAHDSDTASMKSPVIYSETASFGKENNVNSPQNISSKTMRSTGQLDLGDCTGPHVQDVVPELPAESVSKDDQMQMTASEVRLRSFKVNTDANMKGENSVKLTDLRTSSDASASSLKYHHLQMKLQPDSDTDHKKMVASGNMLMEEPSADSDAVEGADNMHITGKLNARVDNQQKHDSLPKVIRSPLKSRSIVSMKERAFELTQSKLFNKSENVQARHLCKSFKNSSALFGKGSMILSPTDVKSLKSEGCVAQAGFHQNTTSNISKGSAGRRIQVSLTSKPKNHDQPTSDLWRFFLSNLLNGIVTFISLERWYKNQAMVVKTSQLCQNNTLEKKVASGVIKDATSRTVARNLPSVQYSKVASKVASSLKLNISPLSGMNKACKAASPEISRLVPSKSSETNIAVQKEGITLKYPNVKLQMNFASKIKHINGGDKLAVLSPSLKRKSLEETNSESVILNPLKRLTGSPREVQSASVLTEKRKVSVTDEDLQKNLEKVFLTHHAATPDDLEANKTNIVPLLIENDGNVEKAEACSKELEDLCNMLKKKHDEAKEILVRAIVNNNSLLMLNHPIYDEKISLIPYIL